LQATEGGLHAYMQSNCALHAGSAVHWVSQLAHFIATQLKHVLASTAPSVGPNA
jgi:hypothetical protein